MANCLFCSTNFAHKDNLKRHQILDECAFVNIDDVDLKEQPYDGENLYNLHELKKKLKECNKVYKNDEDFQDLYEDTVRDINRELNKESVKKALSTVLQTDILNDIAMKVNVIKNE